MTNPMAYMINTPLTNSMTLVKNNSVNNIPTNSNGNAMDELSRLRQELEQIKSKLASKSYECNKLRSQLKQCTIEIDQYKQILSSISQSNGAPGM